MLVITITLVLLILVILLLRKRTKEIEYKCFLLTLRKSSERRSRFLRHHDPSIPLEIIYGVDTNNIETAKKYEKIIDPKYYKEALRLHYEGNKRSRPDITFFNLGAIGCYVGHMEFYKRAFKQNLKYAVIFEDNVVVKDKSLYDKIQSVIDTMGDDFEMCFFHCLNRYSGKSDKSGIEPVKWISSTKCYLIHVDNMRKYHEHFFPIDNHIDMKHEDIVARGARVFYKDLRGYMKIDRTHSSTIGHSDWKRKEYFSKRHPTATTKVLKSGY